jgi:uncharacterized protein YbcI
MASENAGTLTGGELNAAITRHVVNARRQYMGRGPTRARSFHRDNVVVVIMQDSMTSGEKSLVANGSADTVLGIRNQIRGVMNADLVRIIEELTGCRVVASMGDDQVNPDMAAALFVLDRPVPSDHDEAGLTASD